MTRADVRQGIAAFFGGAVYDPAYRIRRPTPLAGAGLAGVRAYFSKRMSSDDYTFGLAEGRAMGAIMVVHLPADAFKREAYGGIKQDRFTVELHIYHQAQAAHSEDPQADLDGLLDAIVDQIHGDHTLGKTVLEAGESPAGITRAMDIPYERNERTESYAVVRFDADVYITA